MKEMLYAAIEQVPAPDQVDPDSLSRYYAKFDEKFFSFCDKELAKINTFYSGFKPPLRFCLIPTCVCFLFDASMHYSSMPFSAPSVVPTYHFLCMLQPHEHQIRQQVRTKCTELYILCTTFFHLLLCCVYPEFLSNTIVHTTN